MENDKRLSKAIQHFWKVRTQQFDNQGTKTGRKDAGNRSAVTGGKHLHGFIELLRKILIESGLDKSSIHTELNTLPGYFRPTKRWDLVVIVNKQLFASIEFKAHIGPSFGNNFNNRVEEALGSSTDILTAYREGKFNTSLKPWLGWLMLLEDTQKSASPVKVDEPHFPVFDEFKDSSYRSRYELFCERLMREQLYDNACLLLSNAKDGLKGKYTEPNAELSFKTFADSLSAKAIAFAKSIKK